MCHAVLKVYRSPFVPKKKTLFFITKVAGKLSFSSIVVWRVFLLYYTIICNIESIWRYVSFILARCSNRGGCHDNPSRHHMIVLRYTIIVIIRYFINNVNLIFFFRRINIHWERLSFIIFLWYVFFFFIRTYFMSAQKVLRIDGSKILNSFVTTKSQNTMLLNVKSIVLFCTSDKIIILKFYIFLIYKHHNSL